MVVWHSANLSFIECQLVRYKNFFVFKPTIGFLYVEVALSHSNRASLCNRGCFINIPLPKAYYTSFCSEKCALWGTASQLGHNPGLWPLRCDRDHDFEEDKLFPPWQLVHISQTSLVIWILEYHLLDPYGQWIIYAEQHNFGVIRVRVRWVSELDRGQGHPSQY